MGKTKTVKLVNIVAAVLFLLLLVVHLAIGKWGGYGSMLTVGDVFVIQPALGFCTGYAFMFGLFYLLQARIDLVESGGRHWLRGIMLLITVLMLFVVFNLVKDLVENLVVPFWRIAIFVKKEEQLLI